MSQLHLDLSIQKMRNKNLLYQKSKKDEKEIICTIGPFPPPINGNSIAMEMLCNAPEMKKNFKEIRVDLCSMYRFLNNKFSIESSIGVFRTARLISRIGKNNDVDLYYYSLANSKYGFFRDCIYLHSMRKYNGARIIVHLHGGAFASIFRKLNPMVRKLVTRCFRRIDKAVVLSDNLINSFDDILPRSKVCVVCNGIDSEYMITQLDFEKKIERLMNKDKVFTILYLSNLMEDKGYRDLLLAAKICTDKNLPVNFKFAGKFYPDEELNVFSELAKGIENSIQYLGVVTGEKKRELLSESDIFVLPTYLQEGMPLSILEAMGNGMPVITTFFPGVIGLVNHEINGLFVEKGDFRELAHSIERLLMDRKLMICMAKNNRDSILKGYTKEEYVRKMIDVFQNE